MVDKKEIGYGLLGAGSLFLLYYLTRSKAANNKTSSPSNTPTSSTPKSSTPTYSTPSSCEEITPDNFSQQLLAQCFGGSVGSCGLYTPLTTQLGLCEAMTPSTNYSVKQPNIESGFVFYNPTDGFFGIYWSNPGQWGGIFPCYCTGSKQQFPGVQNGAFFNFLGLILPNGYTWLPTYEFPNVGFGFLTYQGALWYSPNLTASALDYIQQNKIVYTVKIPGTPDSMGYNVQTYTTPTGGGLCFDYPDLSSSFCISVAPNQTIPFWVNSNTVVKWCPSNNTLNCQSIY
jgi:hypothetical protein